MNTVCVRKCCTFEYDVFLKCLLVANLLLTDQQLEHYNNYTLELGYTKPTKKDGIWQ
jgi:hypothetical protein